MNAREIELKLIFDEKKGLAGGAESIIWKWTDGRVIMNERREDYTR
jgi:hypothetical protein